MRRRRRGQILLLLSCKLERQRSAAQLKTISGCQYIDSKTNCSNSSTSAAASSRHKIYLSLTRSAFSTQPALNSKPQHIQLWAQTCHRAQGFLGMSRTHLGQTCRQSRFPVYLQVLGTHSGKSNERSSPVWLVSTEAIQS